MSESGETLDPGRAGAERLPEHAESLWLLTAAPAVWLLHFLTCYATAAIRCARVAAGNGQLDGVRVAIVTYTLVALAVIAVVGRIGYRRHTYGDSLVPHDHDAPEGRHRFIGLAMVLLAGLSAVATTYTSIVAFFFETCR